MAITKKRILGQARNRDFVGKFSADLFDGGPDLDRDAALAKLEDRYWRG
jgi:hypothetical protein